MQGQVNQPDFAATSRALQQATVTVRVTRSNDSPFAEGDSKPLSEPTVDEVEVFSGVSVSERLILAPILLQPTQTARITRSDGAQLVGWPVVVDEYTGLSLLTTNAETLGSLPIATEEPETGNWILSASAWGIESPIVSHGIISGTKRHLAGTGFPPLLICDVRSIETSSGAPVVSADGELLGIVIATSGGTRSGWTFAVPSQHLDRILRVYRANQAEQKEATTDARRPDRLIVIQRRRPIVGMVLEDDGERIVVARITPGGPAENAGMKVGDIILGLEGIRVRSVYHAVIPTMNYQPGDVLTYQLLRDGGEQDVSIMLGGDVALPASSLTNVGQFIDPKLRIQPLFNLELAQDAQQLLDRDFEIQSNPSPSTPNALLLRAVENYQAIIAIQQEQLLRQESQRQLDLQRIEELEMVVRGLQDEIKAP